MLSSPSWELTHSQKWTPNNKQMRHFNQAQIKAGSRYSHADSLMHFVLILACRYLHASQTLYSQSCRPATQHESCFSLSVSGTLRGNDGSQRTKKKSISPFSELPELKICVITSACMSNEAIPCWRALYGGGVGATKDDITRKVGKHFLTCFQYDYIRTSSVWLKS